MQYLVCYDYWNTGGDYNEWDRGNIERCNTHEEAVNKVLHMLWANQHAKENKWNSEYENISMIPTNFEIKAEDMLDSEITQAYFQRQREKIQAQKKLDEFKKLWEDAIKENNERDHLKRLLIMYPETGRY